MWRYALTQRRKYSWHPEYDTVSVDIGLDISPEHIQEEPQKNKKWIKVNMIKTLASNYRIRFKLYKSKCLCLCLRVCANMFVHGWAGVCMFVCLSWQSQLHKYRFMEFSRQEDWSGWPFSSPGGSSWSRDWTWVFWIAGRFFTIWATREAQNIN